MENANPESAREAHPNREPTAAPEQFLLPRPTLAAVLEALDGGFMRLDTDCSIIYASSKACAMLGCLLDPASRITPAALGLPAMEQQCRSAVQDPGMLHVSDFTVPRTGFCGEVRMKAIVTGDGAVSGVVAVLRDAQRKREYDRMKADFLSVMSHELRTPLTSILGYTSLLADSGMDLAEQDRLECLRTIEAQGKVLLDLVNDLIEMGKLDSETVDLRFGDNWASEIVNEVADDFAIRVSGLPLTIRAVVPARDVRLSCDAARLRQALGYLMDNAVKFSPGGGVVTLECCWRGDRLAFQVTDEGPGIAPDKQQRLFEKFYQGESGASRDMKGTGLGLAIVKRIVDLHGGDVFVESEPGKGSVFGFTLPAAGAASADAGERRARAA